MLGVEVDTHRLAEVADGPGLAGGVEGFKCPGKEAVLHSGICNRAHFFMVRERQMYLTSSNFKCLSDGSTVRRLLIVHSEFFTHGLAFAPLHAGVPPIAQEPLPGGVQPRKPPSHDSLTDALEDTAQLYRRALWRNQNDYVEIWLEKDALAGVLYPVTARWDVPLMVTRGYPSLSYLHTAAETLEAWDKPAYIYYFGDHDPSGRDIPRKVEEDLRAFAPDTPLAFTRVAVEPWQIDAWQLPTRPTKTTDSRAKDFTGESVEVDAITPGLLQQLVNDVIERHVDEHALQVTMAAEKSERELLGLLTPEALARLGDGDETSTDRER